jgi:hypothetical protein
VSAQSGHGLDMWLGVNAGKPALTRAGARGNRSRSHVGVGRDWSGMPLGSVSDRLAGPGDGPMGLSP